VFPVEAWKKLNPAFGAPSNARVKLPVMRETRYRKPEYIAATGYLAACLSTAPGIHGVL